MTNKANLKFESATQSPPRLFWLRLCVKRACWRYLLRLGQGLRASLLGSRENRGLIPSMSHRGARVGGDCVRAWIRAARNVCATDFVCIRHMYCMYACMRGCVHLRRDAQSGFVQMFSLLPPSSKQPVWSLLFIILHGPHDAQGTSHASTHTHVLTALFF